MKTFLFYQEDKDNWPVIKNDLDNFLNDLIAELNLKIPIYDLEVKIRKISKKRSNKQLRAYFRLISVIKKFMNDQGNNFSDEEVSSWVKIKAGHCREIHGIKIAKSIASQSDATIDDMKKIINFILEFGINWEIRDCYIKDYELEELLRFYG